MNDAQDNWIEVWNVRANDENPLSTMGRKSFSWKSWFLYLNDIKRYFNTFSPGDILLDVGGGIVYKEIKKGVINKNLWQSNYMFDFVLEK